MNKKVVCKIIVCALVCIGFVVIGNHMPLLMGAVYNAVLSEFDHTALLFVVGLFFLEIIILQRWGKNRNCYYACLGTAVIAAAFVLFNGTTYLGDKLAPGAYTTLIGRTVVDDTLDNEDGEEGIQRIFEEYYFDDKSLILSDNSVMEQEEYQYIFQRAVPPANIIVDQKPVLSEEKAEDILSYPYKEWGSGCFVLDDCWESTDSIRMVACGDRYIFCSEELFIRAMDSADGSGIIMNGSGAEVNLVDRAENSPHRELKQIMVMLLLFAIGCVFSLPLWGKDYPYLSFFMALPVGAAVWCCTGIVFTILNIPYNLFTMSGCMILLAGIWLIKKGSALKTIKWSAFLNFFLYALLVTVVLTYYKACYTSADSLSKCIYAYRLANYGSIRDILREVAPFGMLEPILHSIGYLVKCDALYVFYPLMAICGIGIMCTGLYDICGKKDNYISMVILGAGFLFLFTNFDFVLSIVVMLAQGPTAVYTLILAVFIVMKRQTIELPGFTWIVTLASAMILVTRVEGAVYVLFFLAVALGIENENLKLGKANMAVAGITIIWNVSQILIIGSSGNALFWTPERGILLIASSLLILIMTWLVNREWELVGFVKEHYFLILTGAMCIGTVVVVIFAAKEIASINLPFYLSHFSNNERMNARINAGAFWTFVLLLSPIVMRTGNRLAQYAVTTIGGFVLVLYFVCLFRADVPLHYGFFDSGRRTLVQIMPTAVWLLAYSAGKSTED